MLKTISERAMQMHKNVYQYFIGNVKPFDKVWHKEMFKLLYKLNLIGKYIRIVQSLYWQQISCVQKKINSVITQKLKGA